VRECSLYPRWVFPFWFDLIHFFPSLHNYPFLISYFILFYFYSCLHILYHLSIILTEETVHPSIYFFVFTASYIVILFAGAVFHPPPCDQSCWRCLSALFASDPCLLFFFVSTPRCTWCLFFDIPLHSCFLFIDDDDAGEGNDGQRKMIIGSCHAQCIYRVHVYPTKCYDRISNPYTDLFLSL